MKIYLQNPPTIRIGGQVTKSLYQFSMQTPDKNELYSETEKLTLAIEKLPGVDDVTNDVAIRTPQVNVDIDRDKAGAMGVNANLIENALYDAYGPRWVSTIYGSDQRIQGPAGTGTEIPGGPARALAVVLQEPGRQADPARHPGHLQDRDRTADHQPLRADPGGHHLVQPEAWGSPRHGGRPGPATRRPDPPRHHQHAIPGRRQGLPEFAGQPVGAADHRHHGGVHRAGHSVRELHPPHHDSLGSAVGGLRRAAHPGGLPHRPEHLRVCRLDHADRHRGEERHHADRFRPGSRARAQPDRRARPSTKAA